MASVLHQAVDGRPITPADYAEEHQLTGVPGTFLAFDENGNGADVNLAASDGDERIGMQSGGTLRERIAALQSSIDAIDVGSGGGDLTIRTELLATTGDTMVKTQSGDTLRVKIAAMDTATAAKADATATTTALALKLTTSTLALSSGSSLAGFINAGTGAVARTVQAKLRDFVHAADFGAAGDGVSDDTAELQAALNTGKQVLLAADATYLISSGLDHVTGAGLVCLDGWATIKAKTGASGFNILTSGSPRTGLDRNMIRANGTDNLVIHNVHFTTDGVTPVVINGIRLYGGMATEGYDLRVSFSGFYVGSLVVFSSVGAGKRRNAHIVSATDCGTSQGNTYWSGGIQTTVVEIDNDLISSTASKGGNVRIDLIRNILYSGAALTNFGMETDGVNIVHHGANSTRDWSIDIGVADGIGELLDLQGFNCTARVGTSKNSYLDTIKLTHGAQHNHVEIGTVENSGRSVVNFAGSTSPVADRDIKGNTVRIGSVINPGSYGLGLTGAAGDTVVALFSGSTSTYKPVNNTAEIESVVGDGVNLDHLVKDGGASANNENLVRIGKASGFAVSSVSAPSSNVKFVYGGRTYTEMTMSAGQSINSGSATKIAFNTVATDLDSIAVTGSNKVTVKYPGTYRIDAQVRLDSWAVGVNDSWMLEVYQGAAVVRRTKGKINFSGKDETALITAPVLITESQIGTANADLSVYITQDTGSARSISNAAGYTYLTATRIN